MEEIRPLSTAESEEASDSMNKTELSANESTADDVMDVDNEAVEEDLNEPVKEVLNEPVEKDVNEPVKEAVKETVELNVDMETETTNTPGKDSAQDVDSKTNTSNQPETAEKEAPNQENMVNRIEDTTMPDRDQPEEAEDNLEAPNQENMASKIEDTNIPSENLDFDENKNGSGPIEKTGNVVGESKPNETENDSTSIAPTENKEDNHSEVKKQLDLEDGSIEKSKQVILETEQSENSKDITSKEIIKSKDCVSESKKDDIQVEEHGTTSIVNDITKSGLNDNKNKNKVEEEQMESESIEDVQKYIDDTSNSNEPGDNKSITESIDSRNDENKLEVNSIGATTTEINESEGVSNEPKEEMIQNEMESSSELKLNQVQTDNQSDDTLQNLSDDLKEKVDEAKNETESVINEESKTYATLENMEINIIPESKETENPVSSELDSFDCNEPLNIANSTKEPLQIRALSKAKTPLSKAKTPVPTKKNEGPKRRSRRDPVINVTPHLHYLDNETNFSGFYPEYYDSTIYMYRGYWCYVQEEFNIPCRPLPSYKTSFYVNYIPSTPQPVVHTSSGRIVKKKEMKDFTPTVPNSHQMKKEKEPLQNNVKKEKEMSTPSSTPKKTTDGALTKKELFRRKYRLPLEKYGWKREIVFRSNTHSPNHTADVYYYSPNGRKLRSIREVIDTLPEDDELKPFHFTFIKEPLGFEPSLEISREAISRTLTSCDEDTPKRGKTPKNYRKVFFDKNNSIVLTPSSGKSKTETPKVSPLNGKHKNTSLASGGVKRSHDEMENDTTPDESLSPTDNTAKPINGDIGKTSDNAKVAGKANESPVKTKTQGESAKKSKSSSNTSKPAVNNSHTPNKHGKEHKKPQDSTVRTKHKASDSSVDAPSSKKRKIEVSTLVHKIEPTPAPPVPKIIHNNKNLVNDVSNQFNAIIHLCKYLRVEDLLRVARVNRLFNAAAHSHQLWQLVKLKNSKVRDWTGLADCLNRHRTHTLDMLKMIGSADPDENDEIWNRFYKVIGKIHSLKRLELGRVTAAEILNAASNCSKNLTEFSVIAQKLATIDLKLFQGLPNLEILQLRSFESKREHGLIMMNIPLLSNMKYLRHLSLTGVKNLKSYQVNVLKDFPPLTSLELGDCTKLDERFPECSLAPLTSLVRLRLEMLQGNMANKFVEVIATLPRLKTLELINIDTKKGFDEVFGRLSRVEHLLIFPTYITQSSTTNWLVLSGLARLKSSLKYLTWGLTQELLRVTTLFIEQWNAQLNLDEGVSKLDPEELKKTIVESNSIPVMKPLPELFEAVHSAGKAGGSKQNISELDILPIDELKTMLEKVLCDTKIKLITVPVSSTTRIYLPTN